MSRFIISLRQSKLSAQLHTPPNTRRKLVSYGTSKLQYNMERRILETSLSFHNNSSNVIPISSTIKSPPPIIQQLHPGFFCSPFLIATTPFLTTSFSFHSISDLLSPFPSSSHSFTLSIYSSLLLSLCSAEQCPFPSTSETASRTKDKDHSPGKKSITTEITLESRTRTVIVLARGGRTQHQISLIWKVGQGIYLSTHFGRFFDHAIHKPPNLYIMDGRYIPT
jgi:hypothetical protein